MSAGLSVLGVRDDVNSHNFDDSAVPIRAPRGYRDDEDSKSGGSNNADLRCELRESSTL